MRLAGMVVHDENIQTANLISQIFTFVGVKISIIHFRYLSNLGKQRIRKYLEELEKNNVDILLVKICAWDMEDEILDHFSFDIMLYTGRSDEVYGKDYEQYKALVRKTFRLMEGKGTIIVNVDDEEVIHLLSGMKCHIVTYGFNSKASITTSSIGDKMFENGFMCCLQRTIFAKNGVLIEPQEYRINLELKEHDPYRILGAVSFAIVNGVNLNMLSCAEAKC